MNKAKAIFAAVIVIAVAGSSAILWQLNDKGVIGSQENEDENTLSTVATTNSNQDYNKSENDNNDTPENDDVADENNDAPAVSDVSTTDINEFLTVFSKVYFSENKAYSSGSPDTYELIRFAYSNAMMQGGSLVTTEYEDDDIGYYNKISATAVNDTLDKYFGKTVANESVYTEKTYSFFKYSDGYFYTPAADGISYTNVSIADSVSQSGNLVSVEFSIYSSGVTTDMTSQQARRASNDRYASGKAEIYVNDGSFTLKYYEVTP
ncbi:MAG: hypothetical protein IJZ35_09120 [Clostridia bacterium]|nr:hypothetical protein [Clostridia bacterium]